MKLFADGPLKNQETKLAKPRTNMATSSIDNPEQWLVDAMLGVRSSTGIRVTPLKALGVATVYACVNLISRTISTLPLNLYRSGPDKKTREKATDHPLFDVLHTSPNPEMTSSEWRTAQQGHLSLRNNSYGHIIRTNGGDVKEIWPLHPTECRPFRGDRDKKLYYRIRESITVPASDVIHLRGMTQNGVLGSDLVSTVGDVFGLAIALEENAMKFFANSSRPGLILEAPEKLSDTAYKRLKDDMTEKHEGLDKVYKAMILEEGLKASNHRSENKDSQFDESRDRQDRQIARVLGVPPHKVGVINSEPRANVEEQNIEYVVDTIGSIVVNWEQHLNMKLLTLDERREGYFIKFEINGLLRGNVKDRGEFFTKMLNNGVFNIDEVRGFEDMNPLPNGLGQNHIIPANMQILGQPRIEGSDTTSTTPDDASIPSDEQEDS